MGKHQAMRWSAEEAHQEPSEISYQFSKDPGFLHQYFRLREAMFISAWGLKHFDGKADEYDAIAHILIASQENLCVGGARILVKQEMGDLLLPMESQDFVLDDLLPEFELHKHTYGEFSRLAITPEFRKPEVTRIFYQRLNAHAIECGMKYVFAVAPVSLARGYRRAYRAMRLKYDIRPDVVIPDREEYEGIEMCLSILDLTEEIAAHDAFKSHAEQIPCVIGR
jgi:hypothetical protein